MTQPRGWGVAAARADRGVGGAGLGNALAAPQALGRDRTINHSPQSTEADSAPRFAAPQQALTARAAGFDMKALPDEALDQVRRRTDALKVVSIKRAASMSASSGTGSVISGASPLAGASPRGSGNLQMLARASSGAGSLNRKSEGR